MNNLPLWCDGLDEIEWGKLHDDLVDYLFGRCDEWALNNFQPGDTFIIWNGYDEEIECVCLIHCYLKRGDYFLDVRGATKNREDIEKDYDYGEDNNHYECNNVSDYKKMIRTICHYTDEMWKG